MIPIKEIPPIGTYTYTHFYSEGNMRGNKVYVKFTKDSVFVIFKDSGWGRPLGFIWDRGVLRYNYNMKAWMISKEYADVFLLHTGGCENIPYIIKLKEKEYWTC